MIPPNCVRHLNFYINLSIRLSLEGDLEMSNICRGVLVCVHPSTLSDFSLVPVQTSLNLVTMIKVPWGYDATQTFFSCAKMWQVCMFLYDFDTFYYNNWYSDYVQYDLGACEIYFVYVPKYGNYGYYLA